MKKLVKRGTALLLSMCILSTGMIVNAAEDYTVKEGDYLKKIARTTYGDEAKWETIYEANKNIIKNPNLVYPGQIFVIPDAGSETVLTEAVAVAETEAAVAETETNSEAVPVETTELPADILQTAGKVLNINLSGDPKSHVSEMAFRTTPDAEWVVITPNSTTPTVPMSEDDRSLFYIGTLENFNLPGNYLEIRVKAVKQNGEIDKTEYTWTESSFRLMDIPSGSDCLIYFDHIAGGIFIDYYNNGVKIASNY